MAIVGYSEATSVYQTIKSTGITQVLFGLSITLAFVMTIYKMIRKYQEDVKKGDKDMKKFITIFEPLVPYVLIIVALPFIVSLVEALFSEMAILIQNLIGSEPAILSFIEAQEAEVAMLEEDYGSEWSFDFGLITSYWGTTIIKPFMIFVDSYLFSMAISGRFLYLLFLEITAPFAIISLLNSETKDMFWNWFKNMMVCYLLIPGFMLANYFAELMFAQFSAQGDYGGFMLLFVIALKIFLYGAAARYISQLIR